jgi:hypothetical protein
LRVRVRRRLSRYFGERGTILADDLDPPWVAVQLDRVRYPQLFRVAALEPIEDTEGCRGR